MVEGFHSSQVLPTPSDEESASHGRRLERPVLSCAAWRTQDNGSAKANMHASKEWLHDFGEQTGCVTNGWQREYIVFLGHSSSGDGGVGGGGRRLGSRRLGSRR